MKMRRNKSQPALKEELQSGKSRLYFILTHVQELEKTSFPLPLKLEVATVS